MLYGIQEQKEEARHEEQKSWFERLGDRIKGFFENLVEDIKGLFIPSSDFFAVYFDELQEKIDNYVEKIDSYTF